MLEGGFLRGVQKQRGRVLNVRDRHLRVPEAIVLNFLFVFL